MTLTTLLRPLATAALSGLLLLALPATAQTFPKLAGNPVVDQADIIPAGEEAALNAQLLELEKTTGHQLVVATVSDLEGRDVSDYGYRLGREWAIGDAEKDDGVVFLIAPNERRMHIAVGLGLEPVLTDALSGRIIRDTVTPLFKANDYPGGIQAGVNAIAAADPAVRPRKHRRALRRPPRTNATVPTMAISAGCSLSASSSSFSSSCRCCRVSGRRGKKRRKGRPWDAPIIIWGGDDWGGGSGGSSWGGGGWGGGGAAALVAFRAAAVPLGAAAPPAAGKGNEPCRKKSIISAKPTMTSSPSRSPRPRRTPAAKSSPSSRRKSNEYDDVALVWASVIAFVAMSVIALFPEFLPRPLRPADRRLGA